MKKILLATGILFINLSVFGQDQKSTRLHTSLIPAPASLSVAAEAGYTIPPRSVIRTAGGGEALEIARIFSSALNRLPSYKTTVATGPASTGIRFKVDPAIKGNKESYQLSVSNKGISVVAKDPAGLFYAMQTLLQLLPPDIESAKPGVTNWTIPYATINDEPRFAWRGLMLDVSRHFFTVDEVKKFIDQMAKYKFNVLHWHLADDQGWRIQINSLPRLTEVGAWRPEKTGTFGDMSIPSPDEPRTYGGFYTHDQVRELVKYAAARYITIVPEIDVPGHSMAAIAAYPELSCTPGTHPVNSGEKLMEWPASGHFYGLEDNSLCPAKEEVYQFLDKVFTELATLFPSEYIHMGGDETARNFWEKSPAIKELMLRENLKDLDAVQNYFVKRVARIIESKGKKMIGWDEIMVGGTPSGSAVMSWHGLKEGAEAAKQGHYVVMTPMSHVYLDYMQSDRSMEPPVYASLRLKTVYGFEPMPEGVDPKFILGGQGNLWTEQVYNFRQVEYMVWPRAFALAEVLWSPAKPRDWNNFVSRVEKQFVRFDSAKVKYGPGMYDPDVRVTGDNNGLFVEFSTEVEGLNIHYSFDNSYPDGFYPVYTGKLEVPKDASLMRVITYRNGKPLGRMMSIPVADLRKRL
ncbi:MAG: family 20 glycosylhydrolase [Chitinophagaceae bacterium]